MDVYIFHAFQINLYLNSLHIHVWFKELGRDFSDNIFVGDSVQFIKPIEDIIF